MSELMEAPSYVEMTFVKETATGRGLNTQFVMENLYDGNFLVTDGRVGISVGRNKPKKYILPIEKWQEVYDSRLRRGYLVTKTKKMEKVVKRGSKYKPIEDEGVKEIVERIMDFASQAMENNFTVKVDDISDEMIEYGKNVLDCLALGYQKMSVAEFNQKLKVLYAAVPRRIDKLSDKLAKQKSDMQDIVAGEQELYDLMVSEVRHSRRQEDATQTILEALGLLWRPVTEEEAEHLKKKMGADADKYLNAWRVVNTQTEQRFNDYCKAENLTEERGIDHLFHGSRTENWWSIVTNGLTINPTGVVITGKAYGQGTYFAPAACKSLGYTSKAGSKWANGTQETGFLAVYKVATGKRYDGSQGCDSSLNYRNLQRICPGAHCTWAEARYSGFMMDEVIVYQDCQDTIEYLIEFK